MGKVSCNLKSIELQQAIKSTVSFKSDVSLYIDSVTNYKPHHLCLGLFAANLFCLRKASFRFFL